MEIEKELEHAEEHRNMGLDVRSAEAGRKITHLCKALCGGPEQVQNGEPVPWAPGTQIRPIQALLYTTVGPVLGLHFQRTP